MVIGAGFGGLAAAIRLGARGYRVTVLDRLDSPGGRGTAYRQDGFTFDAGPTIITAPHLFEELWQLCGREMAEDVDLRALDPFYVMRFDDGSHFTCRSDPEAMRAEIARLSPDDLKGYERFMAQSAERYRIGFDGLGQTTFSRLTDMVPWLYDVARLRADRSVHTAAASCVRDPRLRAA
ncbi:MAG: FAD-dependent oxidoreductase, partial [Pseudomonadota bacterium]